MWEQLLGDPYLHAPLKEGLARFDNYQIYSVFWADVSTKTMLKRYTSRVDYPDVVVPFRRHYRRDPSGVFDGIQISQAGEYVGYQVHYGGIEIYEKYLDETVQPYPLHTYRSVSTYHQVQDPDGVLSGLQNNVRQNLLDDGYSLVFSMEPQIFYFGGSFENPLPNEGFTGYSYDVEYRSVPNNLNAEATATTQLLDYLQERDGKAIAYQSYAIAGRPQVDLYDVFNQFPPREENLGKRKILRAGTATVSDTAVSTAVFDNPPLPNYLDLITGFKPDLLRIPDQINVSAVKEFKVGYYRRNTYESHPGLISLDWVTFRCKPVDGLARFRVPDICLGGLWVSDPNIAALIKSSATPGYYPQRYLFPSGMVELKSWWLGRYTQLPPPEYTAAGTVPSSASAAAAIVTADLVTYTGENQFTPFNIPWYVEEEETYVSTSILWRRLGANNDIWHHNYDVSDINPPLLNHSIYAGIDYYRLFFEPQIDGSIGNLMVDSPRLIELHAAMQAEFYASYTDKDGAEHPRVANLGHLIERIAAILGYRPEGDGSIDKNKELSYVRKVVKGSAKLNGYHGNGFGAKGALYRRLPNKFNKDRIDAGDYVAVHDLPQLMTEILDQLNEALGLQESGAIEMKMDGHTYRYPNQLALLTETAMSAIQTRQLVNKALASSLITQEQTKEIIAGLGLPTVNKNLAFTNSRGQMAALPYWGISPQHSLQKEIAVCTYNVGLVLGSVT